MKDKKFLNRFVEKIKKPKEDLYSPSEVDWASLESRLDEDEKKRRPFAIWWWAAASILILGIVSYTIFSIADFSKNTKATSNPIENRIEQDDEFNQVTIKDKTLEEKNKNQEITNQLTVKNNSNKDKNSEKSESILFKKGKNNNEQTTSGQLYSQSQIEEENRPKSTFNYSTTYDGQLSELNKVPSIPYQNNQDYKTKVNLIASELAVKQIISINELNEVHNDTLNGKLVSTTSFKKQKFDFALGIKPMASSISLSDFGRGSTGVGGSLFYNFTEKTTLELDLFYASQKYHVSGTDYSGINGYWNYYTNSEIPNNVDARNHVIEIPLTLNRTVIKTGKGNEIKIGAGINNVFKLDEKHDFQFDENANPTNQGSWAIHENEFLLANGIKVKAGYSTKLSNKLNINIQPFIDIPLKENAWGGLELNSKGAAITITPR